MNAKRPALQLKLILSFVLSPLHLITFPLNNRSGLNFFDLQLFYIQFVCLGLLITNFTTKQNPITWKYVQQINPRALPPSHRSPHLILITTYLAANREVKTRGAKPREEKEANGLNNREHAYHRKWLCVLRDNGQ